ncbi:hypothetical protein RFI_40428 [Reticulomyxa filosa]|uniref:Glutamyl/glutaminyl-tRNA synthetase class Ib anti-codon binding domain-containing protein n=1 Tax=Reticulomyxa filosa TaxID=46433 RepID=X6L8P1_RETFI|nr:hypothetical protein RFI_40428 [Reticulomyxa filosa]|eukprot:ETN97104.1 hypothetical protein RFI_40428 [Reticulomyxa filosa]
MLYQKKKRKRFNVYPTYDFSCPIVDSLEGVTHAFRSKEYNERSDQYLKMWSICCKGEKRSDGSLLECPILYQFSRQEFTRVELSKRKLSALIDQGKVKGWDDPRLPTIQGIVRRGLQLDALRAFVRDQAMTQRDNKQEWDKLWSYNKKVVDPIAGRYLCVSAEKRVTVEIKNMNLDGLSVPLHPQNPSRGIKVLHVGKVVWIEQFDAQLIREEHEKGQNQFILMNLGVVQIDRLVSSNDQVEKIIVTYLPDNKQYKQKPIATWVPHNHHTAWVKLVELDYLFTADGKPIEQTWLETLAIAEPSVSLLSRGDIVQFVKRGFFRVDKPYFGRKEDPAVLIFVPDGKSKAMSALSEATNKFIVTRFCNVVLSKKFTFYDELNMFFLVLFHKHSIFMLWFKLSGNQINTSPSTS